MGQESRRGGAAVVIWLLLLHLERRVDGRKAACTSSIQHTVAHILLECNGLEFVQVVCRKLRCGKGRWGGGVGGASCPVAPSHASFTLPLTGPLGTSETVGINSSQPKHSDTPQLHRSQSGRSSFYGHNNKHCFQLQKARCLPTTAPGACIPRHRTSSPQQVWVPTPRHQASQAHALPRPHHGPRRLAPSELEHSIDGPTPPLPLQHDPARPSTP